MSAHLPVKPMRLLLDSGFHSRGSTELARGHRDWTRSAIATGLHSVQFLIIMDRKMAVSSELLFVASGNRWITNNTENVGPMPSGKLLFTE